MTKQEYYKQLKHPLWTLRRKMILDRDNHQCTNCKSTSVLQVHHKKYCENHKAWEYYDHDLTTLCRKCHDLTHKTVKVEFVAMSYVVHNKKTKTKSHVSYSTAILVSTIRKRLTPGNKIVVKELAELACIEVPKARRSLPTLVKLGILKKEGKSYFVLKP